MKAEAEERIRSASRLEASAAVSFRKAILGNGYAAAIRNTSGASVAFAVVVERPSVSQEQSFNLVLDAGAAREIGERQGWAFVKGDTVTVAQSGRKTLRFSFN